MECGYGLTLEDGYEDQTWNGTFSSNWRVWSRDPADSWQQTIEEYCKLQLTYEKDRLPAIAALADRMSRVREANDAYVAGMWKNSILSDMWWRRSGGDLKPRTERMAPSWSWAST